jgi:hypothetical protein
LNLEVITLPDSGGIATILTLEVNRECAENTSGLEGFFIIFIKTGNNVRLFVREST